MDRLTTVLSEDGEEEVFRQVLQGMEYHLVGEESIEYKCYCSRERVEAALISVGEDELRDMAQSGEPVEMSCQFCDSIYRFDAEDIKALLIKSEENEN